jgi:Ca2+-binding RTX toxin-like protein
MQALFTDYAAWDFTLATNSAAIDKGAAALSNGTSKTAPAIDLNKNPRPAGDAFDIGAFEAGSPFATVSEGKLVVVGGPSPDSISVTLLKHVFTVTRTGAALAFASAGITGIQISGNDGNDSITIGAGVLGVYVDAGAGDDFIQGGDFNDTITGGAGKDKVYGGGGDDRLNGNGGHDKLYGESGKDRLYGGEGNDTLDGGSSSDRIWGDAGNNIYYGQGGDDYLYARNALADNLFGGSGIDHAQIDHELDSREAIEALIA